MDAEDINNGRFTVGANCWAVEWNIGTILESKGNRVDSFRSRCSLMPDMFFPDNSDNAISFIGKNEDIDGCAIPENRFHTIYHGDIHAHGNLCSTSETLDLKRLILPNDPLDSRNMVFFKKIILFEDELSDKGVSLCDVRIRVMSNNDFYILLRSVVRMDRFPFFDFSSIETRWYWNSEKQMLKREITHKSETNVSHINNFDVFDALKLTTIPTCPFLFNEWNIISIINPKIKLQGYCSDEGFRLLNVS
ncbi:hypothetical protein GJ496_003113 [Pomphorhynchus laevis]|nr:hypothetical protein GJ496_003113 [Pomphorhynchus laevis]